MTQAWWMPQGKIPKLNVLVIGRHLDAAEAVRHLPEDRKDIL